MVRNWFEPVQNWFSKFCLAENQNQTNMSGAQTEPELNQNQDSVQVVLVLCAGSEPNFGIPTHFISISFSCLFNFNFKILIVCIIHILNDETNHKLLKQVLDQVGYIKINMALQGFLFQQYF